MKPNMLNPTDQKKGMLILFQGARRRASTEIRLDRRMHTAFAQVTGADGNVPSKGVYKVRAGEQHPWRVLSRRMKEARAAGAPREQLLAILEEMKAWIVDDLYGEPRRIA